MPESAPAPMPRAHLLTMLLSFTAGFVDVTGFIALFSLFTAHVTGNFVLIGAALAGGATGGLLAKLLALPMFVLSVALTRLAVLALGKDDGSPFRTVFAAQIAFLLCFMALGLVARPLHNAEAPLAIAAGLAGIAAMGIQNAVARLLLVDLPPTTIMTGNTTQAVIDLVDLIRRDPDTHAAAAKRFAKMGPALLAFIIGTTAGALGYASVSFWCLLAPIVALAIVVFLAPARSAA